MAHDTETQQFVMQILLVTGQLMSLLHGNKDEEKKNTQNFKELVVSCYRQGTD